MENALHLFVYDSVLFSKSPVTTVHAGAVRDLADYTRMQENAYMEGKLYVCIALISNIQQWTRSTGDSEPPKIAGSISQTLIREGHVHLKKKMKPMYFEVLIACLGINVWHHWLEV